MKSTNIISIVSSPIESIQLTNIECFDDGSGWVCKVTINSGELSCSGHDFYFGDLLQFSQTLELCYKNLKGVAELKTPYEDEFIKLEFNSLVHLFVTGLMCSYNEFDQRMTFGFRTDQSIIPSIIADFKRVLQDFSNQK